MNRSQKLDLFSSRIARTYLQDVINTTHNCIVRSGFEELLSGLKSCFDVNFCKVSERLENKSVSYICISFLYSSLLTQTFDFRIDFYNKDFYLDEIECESYFSCSTLFDFRADYSFFEKALKKEFIRVMEYEIWEQVYNFQKMRFAILAPYLKNAIDKIDFSIYSPLMSNLVYILYGGFCDKTIVLSCIPTNDF